MERQVVITGLGVVSSLGDSSAVLHAALCEGRSGIRAIEKFSDKGLTRRLGGPIDGFVEKKYLGNRNLRPLDRTSRLVTAAAKLALDDSGWSSEMLRQREAGIVLGTMYGCIHNICEFDRHSVVAGPEYASPLDFANTVANAAAGQAAIWHGLRGINSTVTMEITSGLQAVAYAADLIRTGRADALLAGGAEEFCFESFYGFERAKLLCGSNGDPNELPVPFHARRNGMALGEGAALVMLEEAQSAAARSAVGLAQVSGWGSAYDHSQGRDPRESVAAVRRSIRLAMQDAGIEAGQIDCLSASANGSVAADRNEAWGVAEAVDGRAASLPVAAVKSMLGETLGASGAMQVVSMVEAMRQGELPGIPCLDETEADFPLRLAGPETRRFNLRCGLINSVGVAGSCCSLIVRRGD